MTDFGHPLPLRAFLISSDQSLTDEVLSLWDDTVFKWQVFTHAGPALEQLFADPPQLLVADMKLPDMTGAQLVQLVKSENVYRHVPAVLCLHDEDIVELHWDRLDVDDFIMHPFAPKEFKARIELTLHRLTRSLDANPLSRLPGNTSIINFIQEHIDRKEDFALCYVDLDNFKAFNDKYGFSRGDEALMMSSRIIVNTVRSIRTSPSFIGHVGGDDFVFAVHPDEAVTACEKICASFDAIVPSFYDSKDREQGCIKSIDRKGKPQTFPLMAVSIAVVLNQNGCLSHYAEVSAIAMQLKKKAKESPQSSYVVDRRKH